MEKSEVTEKTEIIKNKLAECLSINKDLIGISEPVFHSGGYEFEVEINMEIPQNNLRTFRLINYTFPIGKLSESGFEYEGEYYTFDQFNSFLKRTSEEIKGQ
ncbi:MAG: hypothetical protein WCE54_20745 [Ignavibacteriaceae bacterium]